MGAVMLVALVDECANLAAALAQLDAVFPRAAERGEVDRYTPRYPEDVALDRHADAVYRAWKHRRLEMPLGAFAPSRWAQDIFVRYSIRRLAFFVPALLADWVAAEGLTDAPWQIALIEEAERRETAMRGDAARRFTDEEQRALACFFDAALRVALAHGSQRVGVAKEPVDAAEMFSRWWALPHGESCSPTAYRPRSASSAESVIELATFYHVPIDPLFDVWLGDASRVAEQQLLDTVVADVPLRPPVWTPVRIERAADHLARRFFDETDREWAERLSSAEAITRLRCEGSP
jgi:hypothetical protein